MAKVYVLGAGASRGLNDNAPLMWELSKYVWDEATDDKTSRPDLKSFLDSVYSTPAEIEDILTKFDRAILDDKSISGYTIDKLRQLRNDLIYLICKVIQDRLKRDEKYERMISLVDRFLEALDDSDAIISLNYDLIVDNRFVDGPKRHWRKYYEEQRAIDYGMEVRGYLIRFESDVRLSDYPPPSTNIPLYKLHGSLNWLYNPQVQTIDVTRLQKGAISYIFEPKMPHLAKCPKTGVQYDPLIITPTFLKDYNNPHLEKIWDKAEQSIRKANEICFVGYSIPDADKDVREMLKRAIFENMNDPKILVIDKSNEENSEVRIRYEKLFGKVDYYKDGFDHYIENKL